MLRAMELLHQEVDKVGNRQQLISSICINYHRQAYLLWKLEGTRTPQAPLRQTSKRSREYVAEEEVYVANLSAGSKSLGKGGNKGISEGGGTN